MSAAAAKRRPTRLNAPRMPPRAGTPSASMVAAMRDPARPPVLEVKDLKKHFPVKKGLLRRTAGYVYAVDGVSFTIGAGETLGMVGESGCGKSTVARTVMRLIEPTAGSIRLDGTDVTRLGKSDMRPFRRQMQM